MQLEGLRVLIVNGATINRFELHEVGVETRTARDAKAAMRTVLRWIPHVLIIDPSGRHMDAAGFLRELRSLDTHAPLTIGATCGAPCRDVDAQIAVPAVRGTLVEMITKLQKLR